MAYLIQTSSGSWYQVDLGSNTVLRWSGHSIKGFHQDNRAEEWEEFKCESITTPSPGHCLFFQLAADRGVVTTSQIIGRQEIEELDNKLRIENGWPVFKPIALPTKKTL